MFLSLLTVNNISTVVLVVTAIYLWLKYKLSYWKRCGVPSPPVHWLYGHMEDSVKSRLSPGMTLGKVHNANVKPEVGVVGAYIFHKPALLIKDPELVKEMFVKDSNIFMDRYFGTNFNSDLIGSSNLFTLKNPEWKYVRGKLSPAFSSGKLKKLFHLMVDSTKNMEKYLQEEFEKDKVETKTLEVRNIVAKYTTDIISTVAFGVGTNSFSVPPPEFYVQTEAMLQSSLTKAVRLFSIFFFPQLAQLVRPSMLGEQSDYFRKVFWDSMDTRDNSQTKRGDIIDSLLELKKGEQSSQFQFQGDRLLAQSAIFFIAGRESTNTTVSFALKELAKSPKFQERARNEINEEINKNGVSYEAVQGMKFLHQVVSETLRLYPPAPLIDRISSQDYRIPQTDIVITKGTPVYVALYGMHRDPRFFKDPDRFDPDRFSDGRKNEIPSCAYMPFGEGPRMCIGARLGILQVQVALISILRNYEVINNPMYKNEENPREIFTQPTTMVLDFKKISS